VSGDRLGLSLAAPAARAQTQQEPRFKAVAFDYFVIFDASTEVNQTYKPDPRAYTLGMERLHLNKNEIAFAAFGAWDAYGAKSFGYPTFWVNRFNVPAEELGVKADGTSNNFQGLLDFVLGRSGG
jgi:FMN phosphatase YigB (HAD superfamily)